MPAFADQFLDEYLRRLARLAVPSSDSGSQQPLKIPYNEQQGVELITLPALKCFAKIQSYVNATDSDEGPGILSALAAKSNCIEADKAVKEAMSPVNEALSDHARETAEALDVVSFWKSTGVFCPTSGGVDCCIEDEVKSVQKSQSWVNFFCTHSEVLYHAVAHTIPAWTLEKLDSVIRPWLRAEESRRVLESDPAPGFDVVGIQREGVSSHEAKTFTVGASTQTGQVPASDVSQANALLR